MKTLRAVVVSYPTHLAFHSFVFVFVKSNLLRVAAGEKVSQYLFKNGTLSEKVESAPWQGSKRREMPLRYLPYRT